MKKKQCKWQIAWEAEAGRDRDGENEEKDGVKALRVKGEGSDIPNPLTRGVPTANVF